MDFLFIARNNACTLFHSHVFLTVAYERLLTTNVPLPLRTRTDPSLSYHLQTATAHTNGTPAAFYLTATVHLSYCNSTAQAALKTFSFLFILFFLCDIVVKALCYKPEGRGFETGWGEWFLSIYLILPAALGPGVYSASNRNECQKHKNNVSGE
jgi:hypothetical protein